MSKHQRIIYLMRGLPSCGKSHTARSLVGQTGVVLETDAYFYSEVGSDPSSYDYQESLLPKAREWNFQRFEQALEQGISPIVVDRGNGLNQETLVYVQRGLRAGYEVELREPDSPWWQELRILLKYKGYIAAEVFDMWAEQLAKRSRATHRVPKATILHWINRWKFDLSIQDILGQSNDNGMATDES